VKSFSYRLPHENSDGDHDIDLTHGLVLSDKLMGATKVPFYLVHFNKNYFYFIFFSQVVSTALFISLGATSKIFVGIQLYFLIINVV
jgi:hypothetical protein